MVLTWDLFPPASPFFPYPVSTVTLSNYYYSRPLPPQTSDHPCFARMPRLSTLLSEVVGGGSCFAGPVCLRRWQLTCKHDASIFVGRQAVNSNFRLSCHFTCPKSTHDCVVLNRRCHRIASFIRLVSGFSLSVKCLRNWKVLHYGFCVPSFILASFEISDNHDGVT